MFFGTHIVVLTDVFVDVSTLISTAFPQVDAVFHVKKKMYDRGWEEEILKSIEIKNFGLKLVLQNDISEPEINSCFFLVFLFYCFVYLFFNWDSLNIKWHSHYEVSSYKEKKKKNIKNKQGSCLEMTLNKRCLLILDLKLFRS